MDIEDGISRVDPSSIEDYLLISLFDGIGSTISIVSEMVNKAPAIAIIAEMDPNIRPIIAEKHGFSINNGEW